MDVKVASLVMAILGTVFGVIFGLLAMAVGSAANSLGADGTGVIWLGVSAIAACIFGMTCSAMHFSGRKQGLMAFLMLVAAAWHVVSISAFGAMGFIFLLLASLFAALGRDRSHQKVAPAAEAAEQRA